jgi:hypothetical protein
VSKNQNHGKMKEWRRPEYKEGILVKQRPFKRRKEKSNFNIPQGGFSSVLMKLFKNVGINSNID